jgi:hypothetical protein
VAFFCAGALATHALLTARLSRAPSVRVLVWRARRAWRHALGTAALFGVLWILEVAGWLWVPHSEAAKVLPVGVCFAAACYWDVRRRCQLSLAHFAYELGIACALVLPMFPCIAIGLAFVFLVLIGLLEAVAIDPALLNWPIYYGILHGPFAACYLLAKRRCIDEFGRPLLPTAKAYAADARPRVSKC